MINSKLYLLLFAALLLGGCNLIYKQSVQQGNAIEQDSLDDLNLGMSKRQVSLIMGTPAIHDPFHRDRWDYMYTFRPRNNSGSQRTVTLYFENDELSEIDDKGFRKTGEDSPEIISEPDEIEEQTDSASETATAVVAAASDSEIAESDTDTPVQPQIVVEQPEMASQEPGDAPATAVALASSSGQEDGFYSVQLGNFTDREDAELLRAHVETSGHGAVVEELTYLSPVRYRVISGQLSERASAEALVETLENDTGHYGFVVKIEDPAE